MSCGRTRPAASPAEPPTHRSAACRLLIRSALRLSTWLPSIASISAKILGDPFAWYNRSELQTRFKETLFDYDSDATDGQSL
jgi:hypothetical protein